MASLKAQIKEFEKKESLYKDKLREEHTQLLNFQKKLAQAGSHLKTLAQENTHLTKQLAQEKKDHQDEIKLLKEKVATLENDLRSSQEGHQKEVKQLVDILETTAKNMDAKQVDITPDVSTSTLLDSYVKSVQKRLKPNNGNNKIVLCYPRTKVYN